MPHGQFERPGINWGSHLIKTDQVELNQLASPHAA